MKVSTIKLINKIVFFLSAIALVVMFILLYRAVGRVFLTK
jgi:hypothetical protein